MTNNSYICKLIHNNLNDWKNILTKKSIKIKENDNLSIFNYDINADFFNPIVQEARGIIINTTTQTVVCWPFRKFGNYHEPYADDIDWSSAKIQEKIDGSIIKIWFNILTNKWQISSNSCIDANDALLSNNINIASLVKSTEEYKNLIENNRLDKHNTYIFELIGPYNQVVIKYDTTQLCLIGIRNNITGEEFNPETFAVKYNIKYPKKYSAKNLSDCIKISQTLNTTTYPEMEGFVVVDKNWHRIKVKSPEYLIYHHLINNGLLDKARTWELIHTDDFSLNDFKQAASEPNIAIIEYYIKEFETTEQNIIKMINQTRHMQQNGMSRKEIALAIKQNKFAYFGFKSLDTTDEPETIIKNTDTKQFLKFVKDYIIK